MAINTTYTDYQTIVFSDWLNNVNSAANVYVFAQNLDYTGTTNSSSVFQAALNRCSSGQTLKLGLGTILIDNITIPTGVSIEGSGAGTILKRINNSTQQSLITATGAHDISVSKLTLDGNSSNNTITCYTGLNFTSCYRFRIDQVNSSNHLGGVGIYISQGQDGVHGTRSSITNCNTHNNGGSGIQIDTAQFVDVLNCTANGNTSSGINYMHFAFPPVPNSQLFFKIEGCTVANNGGSGITVSDFVTGGTGSAPVYGASNPVSQLWVVSGNIASSNVGYGLVCQGNNGIITGNLSYNNGTVSTTYGAGIGLSGNNVVVTNNNVSSNYYYGIDGGGSSSCTVSNNVVTFNGYAAGNGVGINFGGGTGNVISGNTLASNGGTGGETAINIKGVEGDGTSDGGFPGPGYNVVIANNNITLNLTNSLGIWCWQGYDYVNVANNNFLGGQGINNLCQAFTPYLASSNNQWQSPTGTFALNSVAYASTLILPDILDNFFINGTGNITSIYSNSSAAFKNSVRFVSITAGGTGYNPATTTVNFSGGGGSGAAGTVTTDGNGKILAVEMTSYGTNYTSTPSVSFSGGGGSGATGLASISCNNTDGRTITLLLQNGQTVVNGGNISLVGGTNFSGPATGVGVLKLLGISGGWTEISRGV